MPVPNASPTATRPTQHPAAHHSEGNDRQPCFFADIDRLRYRDDLREICMKEECAAHAYDLMTNHVHLLATHAGTRSALCPLRQ